MNQQNGQPVDETKPEPEKAQSAPPSPPGRSKLLEATLELGRNWALATALAAFSIATLGSEAVHGVLLHKNAIATGGVAVAMGWFYLSIVRAAEVAEFKAETLRRKVLMGLGGLILLTMGISIVMGVASIADNQRIVDICNNYTSRPETAVHRDIACQRLYQQRAEFTRRLEGIGIVHEEAR